MPDPLEALDAFLQEHRRWGELDGRVRRAVPTRRFARFALEGTHVFD
jgi:hypothetical protein